MSGVLGSGSVSNGFSACLGTIEVDEATTRRSVSAGQTIYLTYAQGSSFFLLPPPGKILSFAAYSEPFDDNFDDNGLAIDDSGLVEPSPTCANSEPIESSASRCTASITST